LKKNLCFVKTKTKHKTQNNTKQNTKQQKTKHKTQNKSKNKNRTKKIFQHQFSNLQLQIIAVNKWWADNKHNVLISQRQ
jgi:polyphosphate kinase 2 (PPK2 family)